MQGQRDAFGSLPDPINLDFGSTSSNVAMDQQICWNHLRDPTESRLTTEYVDPMSQEARNLTRWNIGESSSSNSQILINHDDRMAQNGWSSSITPPRQQIGQLYEPSMVTSRNAVNLNLNINQIPNGPFASYDSNGDLMDCSNSLKPSGLEHKLLPSSSGSEPPFASSSGTRGFLVEDDDVRLDGHRLSCKRKAIEGNVGQSSNSTTSFFSRESSMWQAAPPSLNISPQLETSAGVNIPDSVNSRLELSMLGFAPDTLHTSNVGSSTESSQRSYRLRMNPPNHQDSLSNNSYLPRATARHSNVPPVHQPRRLVPINPPLEVVPPPVHFENAQLPSFRRNNHSVRLGGASSRSREATTRERDALFHEDLNSRPMPRNASEHPMFMPSSEVRSNIAHNPPPDWSLNGGGGVAPRHVGSSSRTRAGSSSNSTSGGPNRGSSLHHHPSSQYSRRLSEYVRRSFLSSAGSEIGGSSSSAHRSIPSSSQDVELPSGGAAHHGHNQPFSRSAQWIDRHGDGGNGIPYSLGALSAAGEGRSRLVSEQIRNVLDMMRRGEGLRIEDVMILDPSVLFGMADIHDQHRDMRLDVDNMSYEELLALEEQIGSVCTGLSAETVAARMKQRKYFAITRNDQAEVEPCCICQEEYNNGDDLGTLDCGHDFHTECIKQWLGQKNMCPICKTTALAT